MTRTVTISEAVTINLPAGDLWAYVADYSNDRYWRKGLVEMVPTPAGPPNVGTTVHEVVRKFGSTYVTDSTVTGIGPGHGYQFTGTGDSGPIDGGRRIIDNGNQTATFTYDIVLHLSGLLALLSPAVRHLMARGLRKDLKTLAHSL